eukprot:CAMPEP_0206551736 /NCGR_PEP_ID=MMETSP0325_2-20121206/15693_1 /ASSEMBLY_ACC=CAM_ASM_000347 /TAXON_ID=2866 /ORGANISM="Crypthecodinium cohnii, Strain Seligo" /LENGTH=574 /DNA_ID=CAMNT_0054051537 /DNA_START=173 /DNA_END=1897 /DNA_ORIENTATION=-
MSLQAGCSVSGCCRSSIAATRSFANTDIGSRVGGRSFSSGNSSSSSSSSSGNEAKSARNPGALRITQTSPFRGIHQAVLEDLQRLGSGSSSSSSSSSSSGSSNAGPLDRVIRLSTDSNHSSAQWSLAPITTAIAMAKKVFLPIEYPSSVTSNYIPFVQAMSLQMLFSHISRVLATQAMLLAVGVGSGKALPLAAVTAWILKDGFGHLGAIAFGTLVNTRFDSDPKRFRFQAAALGKTADMLSIMTLGSPEWFLLLSTLGSACARTSFSTAQSCRAKIYETFAKQSNLGDVLRCSQAQTVAAQLIGTAIGACLGPAVGNSLPHLLALNGAFSGAALFSAYHASALVRMQTFNLQRAELVFHQLCTSLLAGHSTLSVADIATLAADPPAAPVLECLDVAAVAEKEVFVRNYRSIFSTPLLVNPLMLDGDMMLSPFDADLDGRGTDAGSSSGDRNLADDGQDGTAATSGLDGRDYLFALRHSTSVAKDPSLVLWYQADTRTLETLQGFFHASLFRLILEGKSLPDFDQQEIHSLYRHSAKLASAWWPAAHHSLHTTGWRLDVAFLDIRERRIRLERG